MDERTADLERKVGQLEAENQRLIGELSAAKAGWDEADKRNAVLERRLREVPEDLQYTARIAELEAELKAALRRLGATERERDALRDALDIAREAIRTTRNRLKETGFGTDQLERATQKIGDRLSGMPHLLEDRWLQKAR